MVDVETTVSEGELRWWLEHILIDEATHALTGAATPNRAHAHCCAQIRSADSLQRFQNCYHKLSVRVLEEFAKACHAKAELKRSPNGEAVNRPTTKAAAETMKKRMHMIAVVNSKTQEKDLSVQLRQALVDFFYPIFVFADADNALAWCGVVGRESEANSGRCDALFYNKVGSESAHFCGQRSAETRARRMCHLSKKWCDAEDTVELVPVMEGTVSAVREALQSPLLNARFRRRTGAFESVDMPANTSWERMHHQKVKSGQIDPAKRIFYGGVYVDRKYARFIKTLLPLLAPQASIQSYIRSEECFDDCAALAAGDAKILKRHIDILAPALLNGQLYVVNNCRRLRKAMHDLSVKKKRKI